MAKIKAPPKVSVVIPAKDEEHNIEILLKRLRKVIGKIKGFKKNDFEIIVVCDNCKDKTEIKAKKHGVKTIRRTGNPGKSKALIEGFKTSKGEILVAMDADLSHLPEELPKLLKKLSSREKIGLVIASRFAGKSDDTTFIREIGGRVFNILMNILFQTNLTDAINGYKVFERHIFDNFSFTSEGYAIEIELIANTLRAKKKVAEIPSYEAKRMFDQVKSKVIKDGWIFFKEILSEGWQYNLEKLNKFINHDR